MAIYRVPVTISQPTVPSPCVNVWHCRVETAGDIFDGGVDPSAGVIDTLKQFYTSMMTYYAPSTTVTFPDSLVEVTDQTEASYTPPAPLTGGSGSAAPPGLAYTISWGTSIRARRGKGRTYIGPLNTSSFAVNGKPTTTAVAAIQTACNTLLGHSQAVNGWALGVWGQESAGLAEPKVLRDFTSAQVSGIFAHLRSRRD